MFRRLIALLAFVALALAACGEPADPVPRRREDRADPRRGPEPTAPPPRPGPLRHSGS